MMIKAVLIAFLLATTLWSRAADPLRLDPQLTPGAVTNLPVEQILTPGYAKMARHVTAATKRQVFREYLGRIPDNPGQYEIDHLVSLELGGSNDIKNLWPQNYLSLPYNAHIKDKLENHAAALVRAELKLHGSDAATALLVQIQHEMATDWVAAYHKYVSSRP